MLSAYFDIASAAQAPAAAAEPRGGAAASFGKARRTKAGAAPRGRARPPKPTEAATTSLHAKFEPLPPEKNVPRPAEQPGQAWQGLHGTAAKDDDVALFRADDEEDMWAAEQDDELEAQEDADDVSEPDFEPDSLDLSAADSVSSSMDEAPFLLLGRKALGNKQAVPVYSGPQLCCEDDDFD